MDKLIEEEGLSTPFFELNILYTCYCTYVCMTQYYEQSAQFSL